MLPFYFSMIGCNLIFVEPNYVQYLSYIMTGKGSEEGSRRITKVASVTLGFTFSTMSVFLSQQDLSWVGRGWYSARYSDTGNILREAGRSFKVSLEPAPHGCERSGRL